MPGRIGMTGGTAPELAYWASAVVSGVIVGLQVIPFPIDFIFLLGLGLGATLIRRLVIGSEPWPGSFAWALVFSVVWLSLAWLRHGFPFG
jgi:hypothetical protein